MSSQVISVNRKKYAVGLFWQPLGAGQVPRHYARSLARGVDKKLNLYTEFRAMLGMGSRAAGHRPGMMSLAAEVVGALGEYSSFLAVFRHGDKYLLVAVRNGIILADRMFDTEDGARDEYFKLSEIPDWNALIAPGAWGMPRAVERDLGELVRANVRAVLHSVSRFRAQLFSAVLVWLFVGGLLFVFRDDVRELITPRPGPQVDAELVAEYNRQVEESNKEVDAAFVEEVTPPEPLRMPYDFLPDPMQRAEVCYRAIAFVMQPVTGWVQTSAECGEEYVSAEFKRTFGTLGGFYAVATNLMPAAFVQESSEDLLFVRAALPVVDVVASIDERDAETVQREVITKSQRAAADLDVAVVTDVISNGVESAEVHIVEVAAQSKLAPVQFMKIFEDFGGVYMTRCQWNAATRTWNYEVIIYAK